MTTAAAAPSISSLIKQALPDLTTIRHDLHTHPELGFEEKRTSALVQRELTALGIPFKAGYAKGTGVVAHLAPTNPGDANKPAVALRADMDALPIEEETGKPYASKTRGTMHACGHDGHTTMLLGAARVLAALPHRPNPVTFIFQPAEEGGGGGERMCKEGALAGMKSGGVGSPVGRIFGLHGWPQLPLGVVATRPGPLLASVDDFIVEVVGSGTHAAYPHLGKDPIVCAAGVINALQTVVSRSCAPQDSVVLTVGAINGGTKDNIIPGSVRFIGTIRTLRDETRALARKRFHEIIEHTCHAHGCTARIEFHESYPVTKNDAALAEEFLALATRTLGESRVERVEFPTMGGEDFAYYGRIVPACFFFLGLREGAEMPPLHHPKFDFSDAAIPTGVEMLVKAATA